MTCCLWLRLMLVSLLSVAGFAVSAEAAVVSGTVTNNSGIAGRVYLSGQWSGGGNGGWGISIPVGSSGTANYSIRGVQDGSYIINAFLDTQNSGMQHANDPVGNSAVFNVTGGAPATNVGITLNNPSAVGLQPPTAVNVVPGDGCVLVTWDAAKDTNGREIATSYKVYWSTSAGPGPGNMTGSSPAILANDNYIRALSNGTLYFAVTATLSGVESAPVNANGGAPVIVGAPSGGVTLSGTVTTTGATLGVTPLYVALGGGDGPPSYIARIAAPLTSQAYSIPGVQPGSYGIYAIIDMNNNGVIDLGDISNTEGYGVPVTVAGANVTTANVSLVAVNAQVIVKTNHYRQGANESYGVIFEVSEQMKRPVNVAVSGPQVAIMDMGLSSWGAFEAWPNVPSRPTLLPSPDTYSFTIYYSDAPTTPSTLTAPITGIVDSFAAPLSPVGYLPFPLPSPASFTWTPPQSAPNPYTYSFWLSVPNFNDSNTNNMPSNTTSVAYSYNFVEDNQYQWNIAVKDSLGNSAQSQVNFTSTSSPVITGFTPGAGVPGTPVTITGINFDGTTPANNQVYFPGSGVAAPVVSATTTQLVVTVPAGAAANSGILNITVGSKSGQSSSSFAILPTITMSGTIRDVAGILAGATIELPGNALVSATSGADGAYTLAGLPYNQEFSVKVSMTGYADEYSKSIVTTTDLTGANFRLFADVAGWGVTTGNGVIRGSVQNFANGAAIAGATVTITASPRSYTVMYANATTFAPEAGSATTDNGIFYIRNVTPGDIVTVQAAAAGFGNASANYTAYANAVTVGGIGLMDNTRPTISAFTLTTPYNNLTVPVSSFTAADNAAVTGYIVTESTSTPLLSNTAWSASPPATFTFSGGAGSRTAYGWARDAAGNISFGSSAVVTIDLTAPSTTANPVGGSPAGPINVTLTASEPATIYYTTNGIDPTYPVAGQTNVYTAPIPVSTSTTLKYFARDLAGNSETVQTQVYSYGTPTSTTLSVTGQPATYTTSISTLNLTATVTSTTTPTGSVDFLVDGVKVATVALTGGVATATYGAVFTGGAHAVVANYLGNSTVNPPLAASTGNSLFTVAKANQTITFGALAGKTYGVAPFNVLGSASASSSLGVTYSIVSGPATISGSTVTITGAGTIVVRASQAGDGNYNAAISQEQSFTVLPKELSVSGATVANKVYDSTNNAAITGYGTLIGVVGADVVSVSGGTAAFSDQNVGTAKTVTATGLVLSGTNAANYFIPSFPPILFATANITPAPLTVTADAKSKVYGSADPALTYQSTGTIYAGDAISGVLARNPGENVGSYQINNQTLTAGFNYSITYVPANLTITAKPLTVNGIAAYNKIYNGTTAATLNATGVSLVGVEAGDLGNVSLAGSAVGTFSDKNVGTGKTVSFTGLTLTGTAAGNYSIPANATASANITVAALNVAAADKTKVYGQADPPLTYSAILFVGDSFSGALSRAAGENVGNYAITQGTLSAGTNYSINFTGANLSITMASQAITFGALAVKNTIDLPFNLAATTPSKLAIAYTSSNTAVATVSGNTVTIVGAGSTTITASQGGDTNWNAATSVAQTLTVITGQSITINTPAPLTALYNSSFTVNATSNSSLPVAYSSGSPSICNNSISAPATFTMLTGTGTCIVLYDQAGDATFLPAPQKTSSTTAVKAAQAAVTVTAPASATYSQTGLAAVASDGSGTGAYSYSAGTSTACSVDATSGALTITSGTGTCAITATRQADANYNASAVSAADTVPISKATATVSLSNLVRTYTGSPLAVTATTNPVGLAVGITYGGSSTVPTNAANYVVVATINSANYQGTASGTLVIGKAAATVTISNLTQTADGTPKGVTITTTPSNRPVTVTYNGSATLPSSAGTYNVSVTITDSNYTGSATASLKLLAFGDVSPGADGLPDGVTIADARNYLLMSLRLLNPPAYTGNLLLAPIVGGVPTAVPGSRSVNILDVRAMLEKIVGLW